MLSQGGVEEALSPFSFSKLPTLPPDEECQGRMEERKGAASAVRGTEKCLTSKVGEVAETVT